MGVCWRKMNTKEGLVAKELYQSQKLNELIDFIKFSRKIVSPTIQYLLGLVAVVLFKNMKNCKAESLINSKPEIRYRVFHSKFVTSADTIFG